MSGKPVDEPETSPVADDATAAEAAQAQQESQAPTSEDPGDGSAVEWTTWVEGDHQLSVGCHSREEPTTIQKAACRMAVESATLVDAA